MVIFDLLGMFAMLSLATFGAGGVAALYLLYDYLGFWMKVALLKAAEQIGKQVKVAEVDNLHSEF